MKATAGRRTMTGGMPAVRTRRCREQLRGSPDIGSRLSAARPADDHVDAASMSCGMRPYRRTAMEWNANWRKDGRR
jgi:hypothetical protein